MHAVTDQYDDHSDLTAGQRSSVEEWQMQLSERYDFVGNLVRPEDLVTEGGSANSSGTGSSDTMTEAKADKAATASDSVSSD